MAAGISAPRQEQLVNALQSLESVIDDLSAGLREVSLELHSKYGLTVDSLETCVWNAESTKSPEIGWEEYAAHDVLVDYMRKQGFHVTPHAYELATGWEAVYEEGVDGPCVGFCSEMDALPGIGHACGHNLIASKPSLQSLNIGSSRTTDDIRAAWQVAGAGAAVAVARALKKDGIAGKVVLLGTPAEENGGGKLNMLKAGAFDDMAACFMTHPAVYSGLMPMLAVTAATFSFKGRMAHAPAAPHEGINALDACTTAYCSLSMLRQQCLPTTRIHLNVITEPEHAINVIPSHAQLVVCCRAKENKESKELMHKIRVCAEAAAASSRCTVSQKWSDAYLDLSNNEPLMIAYQQYMEARQGESVPLLTEPLGLTDFGNVSYHVPAIHPNYAIPTGGPQNGNHTRGFTKAAGSLEGHDVAIKSAKGILRPLPGAY